jgi:outer membrane protein OmpA-like peptidoglycan-associated protein
MPNGFSRDDRVNYASATDSGGGWTMKRIMMAVLLALLWSGHASVARAQLGSAIKRKAAEALKDAGKKDSSKAAKPDTALKTNPPAAASAVTSASGRSAAQVWENYDFVPGNKVLFYTDFSEDRVGNFARGLKYVSGPAEVVERDGIKVLRATGPAQFLVPVGKQLPQRFTLEIDAIAPMSGALNRAVSFEGGARWLANDQSATVTWNPRGAWYEGSGKNMATSGSEIPEAMRPIMTGNVVHLRVLMDSGYFKMYANERRLYNVPEFAFKRDSVIRIALEGSEADGMAVYLTSIRVAESETDVLYDALLAKGRWVTQGILFETGKADLRPESRPVLKEIGSTMKKYGDLKILIEGHTDNVGSAASNLALSEGRAAAVKAALVAEFGVAGDRITTKGLGDTKPSVPNTTAAGRAQNRRVEIVKQ